MTSEFPLRHAADTIIFMHRDAHFSGHFPTMVAYYQQGGIGCHSLVEMNRLLQLAEMELKTGENLSPMFLEGVDAEKVARAKESYKKLRDLYDIKQPNSQIPLLIADLILSEEEEPTREIAALAALSKAAVPFLIDLIHSDDFRDPLFPGYGLAPLRAAQCLGAIGDKAGIAALFDSIGENEFFEEDVSLKALKQIGLPARDFLLSLIKGRPITADNERAAVALIEFSDDPEVAKAAFTCLKTLDLHTHPIFATYLALACGSLAEPALQQDYLAMAKDPKTPSMMRTDMATIATSWKN